MTAAVRTIVALVLVSFTVPAFGASPPQDKPIVLNGDEVQIDFVVTDKNGTSITDLRPEEVEVYEDGERQSLTSLRSLSTPVATSPGAPPPTDLTIVVLHREYGETGQAPLLRAAMERFVDTVGEKHRVAVMVLEPDLRIVQPFTADRDLLLAAVRNVARNRPEFQQTGRSAGIPTPVRVSSHGATVSGSPLLFEVNFGSLSLNFAADSSEPISPGERYSALRRRVSAAANVRGMLTAMSAFGQSAGRKSVVLLSPGNPLIPSPHLEASFNRLIGASNRRGVTIYTMSLLGLVAPLGGSPYVALPGEPDLVAPQPYINSSSYSTYDRALNLMAKETGGTSTFNNNGFYRPFLHLLQDIRTAYVASYAPSNSTLDGSLRRVRVKVLRDDVRVRSRTSYLATPDGTFGGWPTTTSLRDVSNSSWTLPTGGLRAAVSAPRFRADNGWLVPVAVEINGEDLTGEKVEGRATRFTIEALGTVYDESGKAVAELDRETVLTMPRERAGAFRKGTLRLPPFPQRLVLEPGSYTVTVGVRDAKTSRTALVSAPFVLPDLPSSQAPVLSGLVVGREESGLAGEGWVVANDPFAIRAGSRVPAIPSGEYRKSTGKQLVVYFKLYGVPGERYDAKLSVEEGTRVVSDLATVPLVIGETGEAVVSQPLSIADIRNGMYEFRVRVSKPGGKLVVTRDSVPFTVAK